MTLLGETKEDLLKALWDEHVKPFVDREPVTELDRQIALLTALRHHQNQAKAIMNRAGVLDTSVVASIMLSKAVSSGRAILSMLAGQSADWLLQYTEWKHNLTASEFEDPNSEDARVHLQALLVHETSAYFSKALEPTCVLFPRKLADELRRALEALEFGDVLPLVSSRLYHRPDDRLHHGCTQGHPQDCREPAGSQGRPEDPRAVWVLRHPPVAG
jgi:hypothetical protein